METKHFFKGFILVVAMFVMLSQSVSASSTVSVPDDVAPFIGIDGQPELKDFKNRSQYPESNHIPTYKKGEKSKGDISTEGFHVGLSGSDDLESEWVPDAWNVIYAETYDTGFWSGLVYYSWKGWGYTGYTGTIQPDNATATVYVRASGVVPYISSNGSSFGLFTNKKQIGYDNNEGHPYYAQGNYSNVKITDITSLIIIFSNESYIKVPGIGNDTWTEDLWFWS